MKDPRPPRPSPRRARTLAAARGINRVALDHDALRGMGPNSPSLL
jgi:hypothetical protein